MWNQTFEDSPRLGCATTLSFDGNKLVEVSVKVSGDERLTGDQLREVRVVDLMGQALMSKYPVPVPNEVIERIRENPKRTPESIEVAGHLHEYAISIGKPASKYVQETLGIPPATAGRWIAASKRS